jgi:subtilisin family serine protease
MTEVREQLPEIVYAQVSPKSIGGTSLFEVGEISVESAIAVSSEPVVVDDARDQLARAGFDVLQTSPATINIAGRPELFERAFQCSLRAEERPVIKARGEQEGDTATFVECPDTEMPGLIDTRGTDFAPLLEGVAIEEPRYLMTSVLAPPTNYWHLDVPGDVSLGCNADKAHRMGFTGRKVNVVMTDSGHHPHPFFSARGYRVSPVVLGPGTSAPQDDENGHGTAESANVFALAPDAELTMVKTNFVNTVGAFNAAAGLSPHVISNSWGSDNETGLSAADRVMAAAIAVAVARGIIVVFSTGNGHFGFPGQHPDVISAGGTFLTAEGTLRASDYSSGFASRIFPGRKVPDLCGLVGMRPRAAYIMLPVQPKDDIDQDLAAGGPYPHGDQTRSDDGWAAISGTSAAAPQLAGACALLKEANPGLTPKGVRDVLRETARDVTAGKCFPREGMNHEAKPGPDLATGTGLVDAAAAVVAAMAR